MNLKNIFEIDVKTETKDFPHFWEKCVGSGHASLAMREDWREQIKLCHKELGFEQVRFHGILNEDIGILTHYKGNTNSSFYSIDSIYDFLLDNGMKPFVELSFMPFYIASGDETIFLYRGNRTPPKSMDQWKDLVIYFVNHLTQRYGREEVRKWYFEVWNEPNLKAFWSGTQEQYFELYRSAALAIKEIDATYQVGGPSTSKDMWIPEMINFCESNKVPLDFVSTHHYPTSISLGFGDIEDKLSKSERGILTKAAKTSKENAGKYPLFYTEWNNSPSSRDRYHDELFAAAFAVKTIIDNQGLADIYSWWTFSDIFEEMSFPDSPFHGGFGLLNYHGIPKPTYHAFKLLHEMGDERYDVNCVSSSPSSTLECLATAKGEDLKVLLYNHEMIKKPIESESVELKVYSKKVPSRVELVRIDEEHGNAKRAWEKLGGITHPKKSEVATIKEKSAVVVEEIDYVPHEKGYSVNVTVPPHAVYCITICNTLE